MVLGKPSSFASSALRSEATLLHLQEATISCNPAGVVIELSVASLKDLDIEHLHLGDNPDEAACQPIKKANNIIRFEFAHEQCDPDIKEVIDLYF